MVQWAMPKRRPLLSLPSILATASILTGCAASRDSSSEIPKLAPPDRELVIPGEGKFTKLDNGLTIFVVPDPFTRLVQFDVRQAVGSREDPPGKSGLAHFVEHLMFQLPSNGPGSPKIMSDLPAHALTFNAYTSPDQTHYMHTGTADELENYMKYTALRLGFDCSSVDDNSFLREREVVRNEHRWRGEGVDPAVQEALLAAAFPDGHPYRETSREDVELASITPDDACQFIRRYYTASQASLVVSGDIDPLKVLALAKQYLEPLPKIEPPERLPVPPPTVSRRVTEIEAPVKRATAYILFAMPPRFTRDYAASLAAIQTAQIAVTFFVGGPASVVRDVESIGYGFKEAPIFGFVIEADKASHLDRGIDELLDAINRGFVEELKGDDPDERATYDAVRQRARLSVLGGVAEVLGRSDAFADYLDEGERPGFVGAELAEIDSLTTPHIQQVGRALFARNRAMLAKVLPDGKFTRSGKDRAAFEYNPGDEERMSVPDDIDPAEAHRPLEVQEIAPTSGESMDFVLDNGMRVVLVKSSEIPVMEMQVIVGSGWLDTPKLPDLANLAFRTYSSREGDKAAANLLSFFDLAGGLFFGSTDPESTTYISRGLSIYIDFIMAGMSERIVQGEYQTGELERWRYGLKQSLKKPQGRQAAERRNILWTSVYGEGHPYVRKAFVNAKELDGMTLQELLAFRRQYYRAANTTIVVTGGFDMNLAIEYVNVFFGNPKLRDSSSTWLQPKTTGTRELPPEPKPGSIRYITEVDSERVQTDVALVYPLRKIHGDDHAALAMVAGMLDLGVQAVRQQLGASYGVSAGLVVDPPHLRVSGALDSKRAGIGFEAIRAELQRLRDGDDFDRRFAYVRRDLVSKMVNAQGDPKLLAENMAEAIRNGLGSDYTSELATKVATVTPDQVKAMINQILIDDRSVTLIQGPAEGVDAVVTHNKIVGAHVLPEVIHDKDE